MKDLIIIGAGPAGIAASLYAARQKLDFLVISKDSGGLANFIPEIETYLGYHYISGYKLLEKFQEHLKDFKIPMKLNETVLWVDKIKNGFRVTTEKGKYEGRTILVASGRWFKRLNIPGEKEFENKGVSFCAACDGPLFKGKTVAVIGGGKSGLLSTLYMKDYVKKIYLIEKGNELGGTDVWKDVIRKADNVEIMLNTESLEIVGDRFVKGLKIRQGKKERMLKVDGIFVEIGYTPNTQFVKNLVKLNEREEIVIDKENRTSCEGIFAAGDCTDILEKQVIVAVGEGAKALMCANEYLAECKKVSA